MTKLIDVTYYTHQEYNDPEQVLDHHKHSLGYLPYIKDLLDVQVIKHLNYQGSRVVNHVKFNFFKSRNKFFHVPFKTHRHIKTETPDVVLVQGLGFPVQVIFLRLAVGMKCKILVQHHAERPFTGIRKVFQKIAARCIDGYIFTATENAKEWKGQKIIPTRKRCYEVLEGATVLEKQNKAESRALLGISEGDIFIWVGRLEANKDPLTILAGFGRYAKENARARLYMIYQEDDLLVEVKEFITQNPSLKNTVQLVGKVKHESLAYWYSAADYYLSGSHKESAGFALIESMNCGCVPIATDIPPFRKVTGKYGLLFTPGDEESLHVILTKIDCTTKEITSAAVLQYAQEELSFKAIANGIFKVVKDISLA